MSKKQEILTQARFDENQRVAKKIQEVVLRMHPTHCGQRMAQVIFRYLVKTPTGYYASYPLERFYLELAISKFVPLDEKVCERSCLLVTRAISGTGGHARVMERWIEADTKRRYSIALLEEDVEKIDREARIARAVRKSGGQIVTIHGDDCVVKGLSLRRLAARFESVLLFTFPWDVEHLIAFGTEEFRRPVGYYNAPDHMFWLGVSITDALADIREWGRKLSLSHRGFRSSMIVSVPSSSVDVPMVSREEARKELGLSLGCHLVVTAARATKFIPVSDGEDYTTIISGLLAADENVQVVCIGARSENFCCWDSVLRKWGRRFELKAYVPHRTLLMYFRAADVVVDSYPLCGIATLEDAVSCRTPILSFADDIEFIVNSPAHVKDADELTRKAQRIFIDKGYADSQVKTMFALMTKWAGGEVFMKSVTEFMSVLEKKRHRVREFSSCPTGVTLYERFRPHETCWSLSSYDKMLVRIACVRPIWLSVMLCCSCVWCKGALRFLLYPLVVLTRPWRYGRNRT